MFKWKVFSYLSFLFFSAVQFIATKWDGQILLYSILEDWFIKHTREHSHSISSFLLIKSCLSYGSGDRELPFLYFITFGVWRKALRRSRREILIWIPKDLLGFLSQGGPSSWEPSRGGRKSAPTPKPSEDRQSSLPCFPKATPPKDEASWQRESPGASSDPWMHFFCNAQQQ